MESAAESLLTPDAQTAEIARRIGRPSLGPFSNRILREWFPVPIVVKPDEHRVDSKGLAKDVNKLSSHVLINR